MSQIPHLLHISFSLQNYRELSGIAPVFPNFGNIIYAKANYSLNWLFVRRPLPQELRKCPNQFVESDEEDWEGLSSSRMESRKIILASVGTFTYGFCPLAWPWVMMRSMSTRKMFWMGISDTYEQSQPEDLYWVGPLRKITSNVGVALRI